MSTTLAAMLLGLLEGLTEFLPVSSTGHLLLAEQWLPHRSDLFNTAIQSGAVLAVFVLFAGDVKKLLTGLHEPANRAYVGQLALAFALTAAGGLVLKKMHYKLPETLGPVAWATLVGGVLFVLIEMLVARRPSSAVLANGWVMAIAMGLGQLVAAVFPGASRSGTTILLALLLGAARPEATKFSFLLGVPTLLAAGAVQMLDALQGGAQEAWGEVALGAAVAAVAAFATVRWLLTYVRHHTFLPFAAYRIVLGVVLLWAGR